MDKNTEFWLREELYERQRERERKRSEENRRQEELRRSMMTPEARKREDRWTWIVGLTVAIGLSVYVIAEMLKDL